MKIALLGGSFNPPHIGHVMIAQQILDFTDVSEVWFVPNYGQNPPKETASANDRLAMTSLIRLPQTRISSLEIDNKLDGKTIHLIPLLPQDHSYVFIVGSDQLSTFHTWGEYRELLKKIPFLVFPRHGYANKPVYDNMTVLSDPALISTNISSTKIRKRVKRGLSIDCFVPDGVAEYIKEHKLYT